jgi:hypothetical protein
VPLKWVLVTAIAIVAVMAAIVVAVLLVDRSRDEERRAAAFAATSTTGVTSPYDLTELPAETDLDVVEDAAFISISVPSESGAPTSYGISSDLPAAQALMEAIKDADEVDPDVAAPALGVEASESTVTFVFPTRETLTFVVDLEQGFIARAGTLWQPDGDLEALVAAAVAGPG